MREACISHPASERMVVLRQWQVDFCEGNHCAAMLLGFFEYWHSIRIEMSGKSSQANRAAEKHGETGTQDESLYQFHTDEQLRLGLLGAYSRTSIRAARRLLVKKGAISEHRNPNPRYRFDSTIHFLFYPNVCQSHIDMPKKDTSDAENGTGSAEFGIVSAENGATSPEITTEITTEISKNINISGSPQKPTNRKRGELRHFFPDDFPKSPPPDFLTWAKEYTPNVNVASQWPKMLDHEFDKLHSDWWRVAKNWMRNAEDYQRPFAVLGDRIASGEANGKPSCPGVGPGDGKFVYCDACGHSHTLPMYRR